jgi:hypothetical protein
MSIIPPRNTKGVAVIAISVTVAVFAITAAGLRVWARRLKGLRLDASDWTCLLGLVFALLLLSTVVYGRVVLVL